jgi:two-component system chemotaxis response regulator CheB
MASAHASISEPKAWIVDGAAGLSALKQCEGVTVVQDPADAAFPEMPATALTRIEPDHVVSLAGMPALFEKLVRQPPGSAGTDHGNNQV